jgi:hypothetical protein
MGAPSGACDYLTISRLTVDVPCTVGRSFWQVESTLVA